MPTVNDISLAHVADQKLVANQQLSTTKTAHCDANVVTFKPKKANNKNVERKEKNQSSLASSLQIGNIWIPPSKSDWAAQTKRLAKGPLTTTATKAKKKQKIV